MIITKHAYKRARQRLGLNRKAFKRMVELNKLPIYAEIVIRDNCIVTVKNLLSEDRDTKHFANKQSRLNLVKGE